MKQTLNSDFIIRNGFKTISLRQKNAKTSINVNWINQTRLNLDMHFSLYFKSSFVRILTKLADIWPLTFDNQNQDCKMSGDLI